MKTKIVDPKSQRFITGFSTTDPGRLVGYHAPSLLVICDEANSLDESLFVGIDSLMSSCDATLFMIGNTILPHGRFFRGFNDANVASITVSSEDHPNVVQGKEVIKGGATVEFIEDWKRKYAHNKVVYDARIRAIFPKESQFSLISKETIQKSYLVHGKTLSPVIIGVDPAREGANQTMVVVFQGVRFMKSYSWNKQRLPETARRVATIASDWKPDFIVVDDIGSGGGVTDPLVEQGFPVIPFKGSGVAINDMHYKNQATEAYMLTKVALESELLDLRLMPPEQREELELQLSSREFETVSSSTGGKMLLESKKAFVKRVQLQAGSPDLADAFTMAVWKFMIEMNRIHIQNLTQENL